MHTTELAPSAPAQQQQVTDQRSCQHELARQQHESGLTHEEIIVQLPLRSLCVSTQVRLPSLLQADRHSTCGAPLLGVMVTVCRSRSTAVTGASKLKAMPG